MKVSLVGTWRIVEMDQWDQEFIDLVSPGQVSFEKGGRERIHFGAVDPDLDWRWDDATKRADFSFTGFDEGDEVTGRGWARVETGELLGHIAFHGGEESSFTAKKSRPKR